MSKSYKAVFFDLDGTLLPIDMDGFLKAYFESLAQFSAQQGYDPNTFVYALNTGVRAMIDEEGGRNNERFWSTFCAILGDDKEEYERLMEEFYSDVFDDLGKMVVPYEEAPQIIRLLCEKGYRLYLTTMPLFPRIAVEKRLEWAGCDPSDFERITTYDNSCSTKPHLSYYQENIEAIGLAPEEILMVGNNTKEDLAAMELGLDGYLITDWLLNPDGFDIETVKHGSMADFLQFIQALPNAGEPLMHATGEGIDVCTGTACTSLASDDDLLGIDTLKSTCSVSARTSESEC